MDQLEPTRTLWQRIVSLVPSSVFGAVLITVWLTTVIVNSTMVNCTIVNSKTLNSTRSRSLLLEVLALIVCLAIIFFADALEIAYSLLRHKDVEQFGETTGSIFAEMRSNEDLVYEGREWLVTAMIVCFTLIVGEFDPVYWPSWHGAVAIPNLEGIPVIGTIRAATVFSIFSTTIPILWLAQGPSKKIARRFPQRMVDAGALVWLLPIKFVGWVTNLLRLDEPTKVVVQWWEKVANLHDDSNLRPSDLHYFLASVQRYGYALYDIQMQITVDEDGSCAILQRLVYYVINRPCNVFDRRLTFPKAKQCSFEKITAKAYRVGVIGETGPPGREQQVLRTLNLIADRSMADSPEVSKLTEIKASLDIIPALDGVDPNNAAPDAARPAPSAHSTSAIDSGRLHYRIDTCGSISSQEKAFALLVEFNSSWSAGAFEMKAHGSDFFYMNIDCPCQRYSLTVDTTEECRFRPVEVTAAAICGADPHWGERDRLQRSLAFDSASPEGIHCDLKYPFPGTKYQLLWKWGEKKSLEIQNSPCQSAADSTPASDVEAHSRDLAVVARMVEPATSSQAVAPPPPPSREIPPPPPR